MDSIEMGIILKIFTCCWCFHISSIHVPTLAHIDISFNTRKTELTYCNCWTKIYSTKYMYVIVCYFIFVLFLIILDYLLIFYINIITITILLPQLLIMYYLLVYCIVYVSINVLLHNNVCPRIVRLLCYMYVNQTCWVKWKSASPVYNTLQIFMYLMV